MDSNTSAFFKEQSKVRKKRCIKYSYELAVKNFNYDYSLKEIKKFITGYIDTKSILDEIFTKSDDFILNLNNLFTSQVSYSKANSEFLHIFSGAKILESNFHIYSKEIVFAFLEFFHKIFELLIVCKYKSDINANIKKTMIPLSTGMIELIKEPKNSSLDYDIDKNPILKQIYFINQIMKVKKSDFDYYLIYAFDNHTTTHEPRHNKNNYKLGFARFLEKNTKLTINQRNTITVLSRIPHVEYVYIEQKYSTILFLS